MSKIVKTMVNALSDTICHNCDHQMIHTDDEGSFGRPRPGSSWDYYTCPKCLSGSSIYINTFEDIRKRANYELASNRDIQRALDKEKNGMVAYRMVEEEKEGEEEMTYRIKINEEEYELLMDLAEDGYTRLAVKRFKNVKSLFIIAYNSIKHKYITLDSFSFMNKYGMNFSIDDLIHSYRGKDVRNRIEQRESLLEELQKDGLSLEEVSDLVNDIAKIDETELLNGIIDDGKFKVADGTYLVISQPVLPEFVASELKMTSNNESILDNIMHANDKVMNWLYDSEDGYDNQTQYILSIFNDYDVEVVEPEYYEYYALIKGHDKIKDTDKYWNYDIVDETLEVGDNMVHKDVEGEYILKTTKDEWNKLGVNNDNAEFTINGIEVEK